MSQLLLAIILSITFVFSVPQKWIVSLHSEATEGDMQQISSWLGNRGYKITETIQDHQLRAIFVEADQRIGNNNST